MTIYPIKLTPVFKQIIWGGERLRRNFNKISPLDKIAESWELTHRPDGMSTIANGAYRGETLEKYLSDHPLAVGTNRNGVRFPLLIKFIDAEDDLSIQVHPDDEYASKYEPDTGKCEVWYIAEADEDACLIYGLKKKVSREEMMELLIRGEADRILNKISIKKGEVYFIPAGHVHAICKGALIAEIQQNSNVTYRMYDYDRADANGKKRELHVSKALDVIKHRTAGEIEALRFCGNPLRRAAFDGCEVLCDCSYFRVSKVSSDAVFCFTADPSSFASLLFLEASRVTVSCGGGSVEGVRGDSIFIPAGNGEVTVEGKCEFLISEI